MSKQWPSALCMLFFCTAYVLAIATGLSLPKYYPVAHTWAFEGDFQGPAMKWFGRLMFAGLLAGVGWVVGMTIEKRNVLTNKQLAVADCLGWVMAFVAIAYTSYREITHWIL